MFTIQEYALEFQMAENIAGNHSKVEQLSLSIEEYKNALVDKGEVYLNGNLYDVVSIQINGEKVTLQVINDTKEQQVFANILLASKDKKDKDSNLFKTIKLSSINYISCYIKTNFSINLNFLNQNYFIEAPYNNPAIKLNTLPPKFC